MRSHFPIIAYGCLICTVAVCLLFFGAQNWNRITRNRCDSANSLRSERHSHDFTWFIERPKEAPTIGWEDPWMVAWKKKRYRQSEEANCEYLGLKSLTSDGVMCSLPAYFPARAVAPFPQKIPRVIFQSYPYRRMSSGQYLHFASWISQNPTYEYILFDDEDVDDFLCENFPENVSTAFSKLVAGASKIDVWRVLVMQLYGGVYLDADLTALRPLPIRAEEDLVSGLGCWKINAKLPGGVLEHWSMALSPGHALPRETLGFIMQHLTDPNWKDKDVIRTTGPGPYQLAFHSLLEKAKCQARPCTHGWQEKCDQQSWQYYFGNVTLFHSLNFNQSYANKLFKTQEHHEASFGFKHYEEEPHRDEPISEFCSPNKRKERGLERERRWERALEKRRQRAQNKPPPSPLPPAPSSSAAAPSSRPKPSPSRPKPSPSRSKSPPLSSPSSSSHLSSLPL